MVAYHAGLPREARAEAQRRFMAGDVDVVVATNAFGMGVDKADVRTVCHEAVPGSIEAYYQEAGRAGRDGAPARCLLFASSRDKGLHVFFIERSTVEEPALKAVARALTGTRPGRAPPRRAARPRGSTSRSSSSPALAGCDEEVVRAIVGHLARIGVIQPAPVGARPRARPGHRRVGRPRARALPVGRPGGHARALAPVPRGVVVGRGRALPARGHPAPLRRPRRRRRRQVPCCDVCDPALAPSLPAATGRGGGGGPRQLAQRPVAAGDVAALDEAIVEVVALARPSLGRTRAVEVLRGGRSKVLLKHGWDGLPHYGTFGHLSGPSVLERVDALLDGRHAEVQRRPLPGAGGGVRVGVLASGEGSNLQAILDRVHGRDGVEVVAVGSDKPGARALERAAAAGVAGAGVPGGRACRPPRARRGDRRLARRRRASSSSCSPATCSSSTRRSSRRFPRRVINVHPALLPAFPGIGAVEQALAYGVKVFGVTVHFVDEGVDTGADHRPARARAARTRPTRRRCATRCARSSTTCCPTSCGSIARGAVAPDAGHPRRVVVRLCSRRAHRVRRVWCAPMTQPGDVRVRRALLSVSDKRGVADFARGLAGLGVELVSTGGTARELAEAGLDGPRDRGLHRASRRSWAAASRRCTRSSTRACSRCATTPTTCSPPSSTAIEFVDLVCVNLYPFERTAARRGATEHEVIENIDIGGPTMIRAAAKNFGFTAVVTRPEMYDAVLQELQDADGEALARHARVARRRGVLLHRPLRHRDRALVRREAGGLPAGDDVGVREGHRPRVRREPAPARRLLRAGRRAHARALDGQAGRGQGPVVQQRARPQLGPPARRGVQRPGLRDHQAQQPVRRGDRQLRARGLRARLRVRSAVGVRRRRLPQPPGRPRARRAASSRSSARCCSRRSSPTRRSSCSRASRTCASSRTASGAASTSPSATSSA